MCTQPHPLIVYSIKDNPKKGTIFFKCFPDEIEISDPLRYAKDYVKRKYDIPSYKVTSAERQDVPCGQCYQCRLQYSRIWANRCVCESLLYEKNLCWFLTLTYSPDKIDSISTESGMLSLNFRDLQLFMKRLRIYYERKFGVSNIRFYAAGEYGEQFMRPHFHILLYNCSIPDIDLIGHNKFGDSLYTSDIISDIWGLGLVCLAPLNWNTAAYTARYVMKKLKGVTSEKYETLGITPEATRMSRRPGIGYEYCILHLNDIYRDISSDNFVCNTSTGEATDRNFYDKIILPANGDKPNIIKPPRYFDNILKAEDLPRYEDVKEFRKLYNGLADEVRKEHLLKSDREYFADLDYTLNQKHKGFYRKFLDLS